MEEQYAMETAYVESRDFSTHVPAFEVAVDAERNNAPTANIVNAVSLDPQLSSDYVRDPIDGSILYDQKHRPITVASWLHNKPLKQDISTRPGPNGRKLYYLSGDCVTRTLNQVFGFDGWNLTILKTDKVVCDRQGSSNDKSSKWHVAYMSQVRITLVRSGCFREDVGAGDSVDKNLATAVQHALKGSITDAMKRAAKHFGDKLGNILYSSDFKYNQAPVSSSQAMEQYENDRCHQYASLLRPEDVNAKVPLSSKSSMKTNEDRKYGHGQILEPAADPFKVQTEQGSHCSKTSNRNIQEGAVPYLTSAPVYGSTLQTIPSNASHLPQSRRPPNRVSYPLPPSHQRDDQNREYRVPTANNKEDSVGDGHDLQKLFGDIDESFWPAKSPTSSLGQKRERVANATQHAQVMPKRANMNPYAS